MRKVEYTRAAKLNNCVFTDDFIQLNHEIVSLTNKTINFVIKKIQSGEFEDIKGSHHNIILDDETILTHAKFREKYHNELYSGLETKGVKSKIRDLVVRPAIERIASNKKRNKKEWVDVKIPAVKPDKSLYVKGTYVSLNEEKTALVFSSFLGDVEIPFNSKFSYNLDKLDGKFGGNFHLEQKTFVAQIEKSKDALYEVEDFLGFDINLGKGCWLVFSKQNEILDKYVDLPEDIHDLIEQIKTVNKAIADVRKPVPERTYRTKTRTKQRKVWIKLHKKLKKAIRKIAREIIDVCIANKYCLCIDNLASGEKNGTFGQDHLVEELKTMCEDERVPFYSIPTFYTSQTCSSCGHRDKKNLDRETSSFCCLSCGHTEYAHMNASKNIANFGKDFYDANIPFSRMSKYRNQTHDQIVKSVMEALDKQTEIDYSIESDDELSEITGEKQCQIDLI